MISSLGSRKIKRNREQQIVETKEGKMKLSVIIETDDDLIAYHLSII